MRKLIASRGPYKLVALSTSVAELYIYGAIGKGWWSDTGIEAIEIINALQGLSASEIRVRIASDGGSVTEGLAINTALRRHPAKIVTIIDSIAASIASAIFVAGDERIMPSNTMLMLHGAQGDGGIGNAQQIRERADQIEKVSEMMVETYAVATGDSHRDAVTAMLLDGKDHYLSADEAFALGLCTKVEEALPLAAVRRVDLSRLNSLPAAAAAYHQQKEPLMNYRLVALLLGLSVSATATEVDLRSAVLTALGLDATATEADIEAKIAARTPTPPTPTPAPAPAVAAAVATRVNGMFAAALNGQASNERLVALQRQAQIDMAAGREINVETLREQIIAAAQVPAQPVAGQYVAVQIGEEDRDKRRVAASTWLLARAAVYKRGTKEATDLAVAMNGNPFRGMSMGDLARACLEDAGVNVRGMNRHAIISAAITHSTSDFPNIFENALHKTLLAGFTVIPTTWDKVCKIGSLSDFRPHIRYRSSHLGNLEVVQANGEYKTLQLNDAERESIQAKSRGGIINISREMIVNDDMGVFSDLTLGLGKSASRTRELAFYAALAENAGMGPTMGDGKALFHVDHANISLDPGAPTVVRLDKDRQQMASQKDPSGHDFVDIRPSIWLGPLALGGTVRIINNDQYDPDAANKLQRTNIARGMYDEVLDTPRLSGAPYYSFANPNLETVFEMGFLDGEQTPQIATEEAFNQNGMKWRIVDEWGLGATGTRGAIRNAGTT